MPKPLMKRVYMLVAFDVPKHVKDATVRQEIRQAINGAVAFQRTAEDHGVFTEYVEPRRVKVQSLKEPV